MPVDLVEPELVDTERAEPLDGGRLGDHAVVAHLDEVAHPAQQPVGDPRRAPRLRRRSGGRRRIDRHARAARAERWTITVRSSALVELDPADEAEPVAQGRGDQADPGRGAHQREARQVQPDGTRAGSLADHDVELASSMAG